MFSEEVLILEEASGHCQMFALVLVGLQSQRHGRGGQVEFLEGDEG